MYPSCEAALFGDHNVSKGNALEKALIEKSKTERARRYMRGE
jgi:hypothetical protein